ncbi:zinc ribbon domain-containing protein [Streptomyces mirabilis]|uniref:zinc ribbon domain-containing protein n=1 Tax=Streptomyces mirabilis TaxID=68239 RepID=UPI003674624D
MRPGPRREDGRVRPLRRRVRGPVGRRGGPGHGRVPHAVRLLRRRPLWRRREGRHGAAARHRCQPDRPGGHTDRANRVSQAWFACRNCGFVDHADRNGSRNIRARAWELWRRGAQSTAPAPPRKHPDGAGRKRSITPSDARCASPSL